ncbi:uncharacterized protein LOC111872077 isoform X2 [Cryptotermes secundus]|nr:uncharacterized protein LOC111872077 isoform X2 [Cryptotermes secundus]
MDTPRKGYGRHKNYFWKPGESVNQHFDLRHRVPVTYHKKIPCRWENRPRGGDKQGCFSHLKNPCVPPRISDMGKAQRHRKWETTSTYSKKNKNQQDLRFKILSHLKNPCVPPKISDMGKAQLHRKWATTSTRAMKNKNQQDLRFKILEIRTQKCSQPDEAAAYVQKSKPWKPEHKAAASGWARGAVTSLRALILSKTAHPNSKAHVAVSAKNFNNDCDAEHKSNTSEAMFQRRKRRFKSDYSFKENRIVSGDAEHKSNTSEAMFQRRKRRFKSDYSFKENRIVSGDSVTLVLSGKCDSNNDDTLTGAVQDGHTDTILFNVKCDSNNDDTLTGAVQDGHTDTILFNVKCDSNNDDTLTGAVQDGHTDTILFNVKCDSNNDDTLTGAVQDGHTDTILFNVKCDSNNDDTLTGAVQDGHTDTILFDVNHVINLFNSINI